MEKGGGWQWCCPDQICYHFLRACPAYEAYIQAGAVRRSVQLPNPPSTIMVITTCSLVMTSE